MHNCEEKSLKCDDNEAILKITFLENQDLDQIKLFENVKMAAIPISHP